jgi:hypothetical protein
MSSRRFFQNGTGSNKKKKRGANPRTGSARTRPRRLQLEELESRLAPASVAAAAALAFTGFPGETNNVALTSSNLFISIDENAANELLATLPVFSPEVVRAIGVGFSIPVLEGIDFSFPVGELSGLPQVRAVVPAGDPAAIVQDIETTFTNLLVSSGVTLPPGFNIATQPASNIFAGNLGTLLTFFGLDDSFLTKFVGLPDFGTFLTGVLKASGTPTSANIDLSQDNSGQVDLSAFALPATVTGGNGSDTVIAGLGNTNFTGGNGDDTFIFNPKADGVMNSFDGGAGTNTFLINLPDGNGGLTLRESGNLLAITYNGRSQTIQLNNVTTIKINGGAGNDTFTIDMSGGAIPVPLSINGGNGENQIVITGNKTPQKDDIYIAKISSLSGRSEITMDGVNQQIFFENFDTNPEFIEDDLPGSFEVHSLFLGSSFFIGASQVPGFGVVSNGVQGPVRFSNKVSMTVDGNTDADDFVVDMAGLPSDLKTLTLNGGSSSDSALLLGSATNADHFTYTATGGGESTVAVTGAVNLTVNTTGIEGVTADGQGQGTLSAVAANADITLGDGPGNGTIASYDAAGNGLQPLDYTGMNGTPVVGGGGSVSAQKAVVLSSSSNAALAVSNTGVVTATNTFGATNSIDLSAFHALAFDLSAASVPVNITPSAQFPGGISVAGGNPGANDTLSYTAPGGGATVVNFATSTITASGVNPVSFSGVTALNLSGGTGVGFNITNYGAATAVQNLNITGDGAAGTDKVAVTTVAGVPSTVNFTSESPTAAQLTRSEGGPAINISSFNRTAGNLTLTRGGNVLGVNFIGSTSRDSIAATHITGTTGGVRLTQLTGVSWVPLDVAPTSTVNTIAVLGGLGDDTFTVDNSNGAVALSGGIFFDGGAGNNTLVLQGTTAASSDTYTPGPAAGQGTDIQFYGAVLQEVTFANLTPFINLVPAASLTVDGTNADNAINYTAGPNSGITNGLNPAGLNTGQVSVDGFESTEFANKSTLIINGLAGSDTFNLNNPTTPAGLTGITVNGGDPTGTGAGGDTLVANGTAAINFAPTGPDAGTITGTGPVNIAFATIEQVQINAGNGHTLTETTPNNNELTEVILNPSASAFGETGTIQAQNGSLNLVPLTYTNLNSPLSFASTTGARNIILHVNGAASSDGFEVNEFGPDTLAVDDNTGGFGTSSLFANLPGVAILELNGNGGVDTFTIFRPVNFGVTVHGNGNAGDVANVFGASSAVTVLPGGDGIINGPVIFDGFGQAVGLIDVAVADIGAGGNTVRVSGPGSYSVSPTAPDAATMTFAGAATTFNFTGVSTAAGGFSIDPFIGSNPLTVNGTAGDDAISVAPAGTSTRITVGALLPVNTVTADTSLVIAGSLGNDNLTVDSTAGPVTIPITYDGGSGSNSLTFAGGSATADTYTPGPQAGSGLQTLNFATGVESVHFTNLAPVYDLVSGPLVVNGTNADDAINYTQGGPIPVSVATVQDGNANTLQNEIQLVTLPPGTSSGNFTLTFNGQTTGNLAFNASAATVQTALDALSSIGGVGGSVTVTHSSSSWTVTFTGGLGNTNVPQMTGALTVASGMVSVDSFEPITFTNKTTLTINGLAGDDTINLNNPNTPTGLTGITVNGGDPTASDTVIVNGTTGADTVTIDQLTLDGARVTGLGPTINVTGDEHLTYNGQGGDDSLTVTTPAGGQVVTVTPGAVPGEGSITARNFTGGGGNPLVPIAFTGISANGSLSIADVSGNRTDYLIVAGTAASDIFGVDTAGHVTLNAQAAGGTAREVLIPVSTPGASFLELQGQDGDDTFNVPGNHPFTSGLLVDGGNPSASDVLNFTGNGAGAVTVDLGASTVTEAGFTAVSFSGVEVVNVNAGGAKVTVVGTANPDSISVTPTGAAAATLTSAGLNTTFNFSNVSPAAGGFTIDPLGGSNTVTVNGTSSNDAISVARTAATDTVTVNALLPVNVTNADTQSLVVATGNGVDGTTVSGAGGPVLTVAGGQTPASSTLTVINTAASGNTTESQGPTNDSGTVANGDGTIKFSGLTTVTINDNAASTTNILTVNGTNGNDAITAARLGANNIVWVNAQAVVVFSGFNQLTLAGRFGNDYFAVSPIGMTFVGANPQINVTDVTLGASTLQVNGSAAANAIGYNPTAPGAGNVTITGSAPVFFTNLANLAIAGQGGPDALTVTTPAGVDRVSYTPGATADSGIITARGAGGGVTLVPLTYTTLGAAGNVTFASAGGREDVLTLYGTNNTDVVNVNGPGDIIQLATINGGFVTPLLHTGGINILELDGLAGDDTFNLSGSLPYGNGTFVDGGDPSASDTVNLSGATGAVTVSLGSAAASTNTVVAGYGSLVTLLGVEVANLDANGQTLTVDGTSQPESITYTPTGASAGTVTDAGLNTVFNFSSVTAAAGGFTIDAFGGSNTVTVNGTAGGDAIAVVRGAANDTVQVNALQTVTLVNADTQALVVATGTGTDTTSVSGSGGPTLTVNGGQVPYGDSLVVVNSATSGNTSAATGNTDDSGRITNADGTIDFTGMNLVIIGDNAASTTDTLSVIASNGNDMITAAHVGSANEVTVNANATVAFSGFNQLSLFGDAGNDSYNVSPVGMTFVGANPQINVIESIVGSGTMQVNGTSASNAIGYNPTAPNAGNVTITGSTPVFFTNLATLAIAGQGGPDALTVTTPAGVDRLSYTPGATADSATITARGAGGGVTLVPVTFTTLGAAGSVTFASAGGREDVLTLYGTSNTDEFDVNGPSDTIQLTTINGGFVTPQLHSGGINILELDGLAGDDTFNLSGSLPYGNGTFVDGGDPSASDTVNLSGATGAVTVSLGSAAASTNTVVAGYGSLVTLLGVEVANLDANGNTMTVVGTSGADTIAATPTGANSVTFQAYQGGTAQNGQGGTLASLTALAPVFNATSVSAAAAGFSINGGGGSDMLFVEGTQGADTIDVNDATSGANAAKVNSLLVVNYNASMAQVEIDALAGSDTINLAPSTTTAFLVDGGDPIGVQPGDTLNMIHPPAFYQLYPGPTKDSGGVRTAGFQTMSWVHIETIINTGGTPILVGTNGNDEITIIARDSAYNPALPGVPNPLLDGVQDFTASLNDGPDMLFINQPFYLIDGLSGNDDIVVREPAPNQAAWNVQLYVAGGAPASDANRLGDNIELETPGTQSVTYNPNNALASIPALPGAIFTTPAAGGGQFNDGTNTSTINAVQFLIPLFFQSSAGGAENFIYTGESGNDTLTYNTPANANAGSTMTYTPGAAADAGSITGALTGGAALTPLTFNNLGGTGHVAFTTSNAGGRTDHLNVEGSPNGEAFSISSDNGGHVQITRQQPSNDLVTLPIFTPSVNTLELDGNGGNDTFNISAGTAGALPFTNGVVVNADATINLSGAVGPVTVFEGDNTPNSPNPNTVISGYGAPVILMGVDTANLDVTGQTLTATGTTQNDNWIITPTAATAGTFYDSIASGNNQVPNTVYNAVNVAGNLMVFNDPGGNADQVTLRGTAARDMFQIAQGPGIAQVFANNVTPLLPVQLGISAEILTAQGLGGEDTFQVIPAPGIAGQAQDNMLINVDGGSGGENNSLEIGGSFGATPATLAANVFAVVNRGSLSSGTVRVFTAAIANPDINYTNVQTVSPTVFQNAANPPGLNPNLLVMGPDIYEPDNAEGNAAFVGSGSTLQIQRGAIFPNNTEFPGVPADSDYYRVVAQATGTLDFQVYFRTFSTALLPGGGQLNLQAFDVNGNVIASAPGLFGADPGTGNARIRIPAVAGQSYFLRVLGSSGPVVNGYDATIINTPPPAPFNLELSRSALLATVTNPGAGYTSAPQVQITGGGGSGATGTAYVANGQVIAVTISEGTGYTSAPNITLVGGGGAGATAVASFTSTGDLPPNAANADSGRSQFDNLTKVNTPTIFLRLNDGIFLNDLPGNGVPNGPPAGVIPIPFSPNATTPGYRVAIFDGNNSQTPVGFATPVGAGFPGLYQFTFTTPLADGIHHINAAVQMVDPANPTETGFGPFSTISLDITVDTLPPPTFFGTADNAQDGLDAGSDSGPSIDAATLHDRVTNVTTPTFYGTAEANAIIRVYAIVTQPTSPLFGLPLLIGQTVATPIDGTNAFPNGRWVVQSNINLNDPRFFVNPNGVPGSIDGTRTIQVTGEDAAGNVSAPSTMVIFLDTQGPNVNGVQVTGSPGFNLFALKPQNFQQGPTPLVNSLTILIVDKPDRDAANFPDYVALDKLADSNPGLFTVIGDQVGYVALDPANPVVITNNPPVTGQPATATIQLNFVKPLPDDRYTLTISDSVVDPANNKLDGESNAAQPGSPIFPSGNGVPGGNFVARFTVDSHPHVGVFGNAQELLDINGNGFWDPVNAHDAVNDDEQFAFGLYTDNIFVGSFAPAGQLGTGFQTLGAYGFTGGAFRWILSFTGQASADYSVVSGLQINGLPVAGRFNPALANTDEIALFDGHGNWYIDFYHTNNLGSGTVTVSDGLTGYPVVGDFTGDGNIDLATYQPDTQTWEFDIDALTSHHFTTSLSWGFPAIQARPVAADMNRDGLTDIGLFVPVSLDSKVNPGANWYFLVSQNGAPAYAHAFNPSPNTNDQFYSFGPGFDLPIVGIWDPPAPANTPVFKPAQGSFTDVTLDAQITTVPNGGYTGLIARRSANGNNGLWGGIVNTGGVYSAQIRRLSGGTWQTLASTPVANFLSDSTLELQVVGTTIQLSLGGTVLLSAADSTLLAAGGAGDFATPGSVIWPAQATAIDRTQVPLPFSDALDQANGQLLGTSWDEYTGSFRTQPNGAVAQAAIDIATVHSQVQADVSASVDVTNVPAGGFAGLLSRYTAATGNTYRAGIASTYNARTKVTSYSAQIWRKFGGTWTLLASQPIATGTGTLTLLTAGGAQQLYLNGAMVLAASDKKLTTGAAGIYATQGAVVDNFAIAPVMFSATNTPFADSFGGLPPGVNWYTYAGGFAALASGLVGMGANNALTLSGVSMLNVSVQAQIGALPPQSSAGVLARTNTGTGDTYWAGIVSSYDPVHKVTTYKAQIKRTYQGVTTVLFSSSKNIQPGLLRFDVNGTSLSLYLNGNLVGTARDTRLKAGTVGISGGLGSQFSSFQAK